MGLGMALLGIFEDVRTLSAAPEGDGAYSPPPDNPDAGQGDLVIPIPDGGVAAPVIEVYLPSPIGGGGWSFDIPPPAPAGGEAEEPRLPEPPIGGSAS